MAYRHLFFDLDHTLWDFETNANETLATLYERHDLARYGTCGLNDFNRGYSDVNHALWRLYQANKVTQKQLREVRFVRTLAKLGVAEADVPPTISAEFTDILPQKSAVFPHTHETLEYLRDKYTLHLITNGFEDVQHRRLPQARPTHVCSCLTSRWGYRTGEPDGWRQPRMRRAGGPQRRHRSSILQSEQTAAFCPGDLRN